MLYKNTDTEWLFIDGSIIRAHQHSSGAASTEDEAIGKSRGGRSTKIHLAVDSYGLPVHFELSGGQVHGSVHAESLVEQSPPSDFVIADKGYDSQAFRNHLEQ
ncbi:transposase (fragment) [Xenorhabdus bovienii str. oregonense]|uniref:Transposase n=1 Tax=Xenorhabdus bovienii str. oregonense TaxID=1398202 RepID=A0A077PAR0_XENBV